MLGTPKKSSSATMSSNICVVLVCLWLALVAGGESKGLGRSSFPKGFIFGVGSSAYQYEGANDEGGRGPSIWDTFARLPGKIVDGTTGNGVDQYHRYKEDVKLIANIGLDSYRFSISWSRIFPKGAARNGGLNKEGVAYYNNLINELLEHGIQPFVTLFHWDVPQALENEYGGFRSPNIVPDFGEFANTCFRLFGDRVKHWITLNEPLAFVQNGYANGAFAPGRCSAGIGNCTGGNSGTEPYIVTHNMLLAHAAAVHIYRNNFKAKQNGSIGISLISVWFLPYSKSVNDQRAAKRAIDFNYGWYMEPLVFGHYPKRMESLVGAPLPRFTASESRSVKGSYDFLGINYYTSQYAKNNPNPPNPILQDYTTDYRVTFLTARHGASIGQQAGSPWLYVYPSGIKWLLDYTKSRYLNPPIIITENGVDEINNASKPLRESLNDTWRIRYHSKHLLYVLRSIRRGSDIRGYFLCTLLDDWEWNVGYTVRFGLHFVDFKDKFARCPKKSAYWSKLFLKT